MATVTQGSGFAQRIPYAFARAHGVLAQSDEPAGIVVLTRPDATVEGLAELKRVLQRPLLTRPVDATRFATELARTYNVEGGVRADERGSRSRRRSRAVDAGPSAGRGSSSTAVRKRR
jgi:general secretion pathway protein E